MKHTLKRLFSLLLALCLVMSALPVNIWAEGIDDGTGGDPEGTTPEPVVCTTCGSTVTHTNEQWQWDAYNTEGYQCWHFEHLDIKINNVTVPITIKTQNMATGEVTTETQYKTVTMTNEADHGLPGAKSLTFNGITHTNFQIFPEDNDWRVKYDTCGSTIVPGATATMVVNLVDDKGEIYEDVIVSFDYEGIKQAIRNCDSYGFTTWDDGTSIDFGGGLDFNPGDGVNNFSIIYNKYTIPVEKIWDDANDQDGLRPDEITINLLADGELNDTLTLNAANNWKSEFKEKPSETEDGEAITYTIEEVGDIEGYTSEIKGTKVINTHVPATISINATKAWNDDSDRDGLRPDEVVLTVYADDEPTDKTVTLTEANGWTAEISGLAKNKNVDGVVSEIVYTLEEESVAADYTADVGRKDNNYTVTNTHVPAKTDVTVKKIWDDSANQDGLRPSEITVNLMADGKKVASAVIKEDEAWTYTFTNLPVYDQGTEITYTAEEVTVDGYTPSYSEDKLTITNKHVPAVVTVSGAKTWIDNNNAYKTRPESITIKLLADGEQVASKDVTAADGWKYEFKDLPEKKAGKAITYTITEDAVEGYNTVIAGYNVTNTLAPHETSVDVTKVWNDADNQDGKRPANVTVKLFANDIDTGKTLTLTGADNSWSGTFTELPKYDEKGVLIVYTVKEVAVAGYTTTYSEDTLTITNSYNPETTEVSGVKIWDDKGNQDGKRPASVTIRLLAGGKEVASKTVTKDDNWTYEFTDLPKFNAGQEIVYTVSEDSVVGYTTTYDKNSYNVTNQYTPEQTGITVTKVWEDANNQDGIRPETVTVNLLANGKKVASAEIGANGTWSHTFTELPVYENGVAIKYTAEEVSVTGYTTTYSEDKLTITNKHVPAVVTVSGAKTWIDNNNAYETRPESITVNVLADGEKVASKVVTAADGWKYEFKDLPEKKAGKAITYTITEDAVEGYNTAIDGHNVTNTLAPHETSVAVTKVWNDADNQDGKRPANVTIKLFANNVDTGKTLTVAGDDWKGTFTDLPKYDEKGVEIVYTVKEVAVADYTTTYSEDTLTITNSYTPETIEISGTKTWDDKNNQDGKRPSSITIRLLADGKEVESATVTAANGWSYKFQNLPKFKAGKEIGYTITEDTVEGYTTIYAQDSYNVTNQYTPEQTSVTITKVWDDADDQDGIRPETITINLFADDKKVASQQINAEGSWTHTFTGLDAYANGKKITYTITEDAVEKYDTDINGDATKGFVVTNSHTPYVVEVSGSKTWIDNNNAYETRPESITINVLADGEKVASKVVTAADDWQYEFTNLPKNKAGKAILYSVTEDAVEGYDASINGYNVTNRLQPHETSVEVTKVWDDADNQDGKRPANVTVKLFANGVDTGKTLTLTGEGNNWTGIFEKLDKYDAQGVAIVYTIKEVDVGVAGYSTTYSEDTYTITNSYTPETIEISGAKTWDDKNNQDGKRPSSITIRLLADGKEVESATVTAANGWNYKFQNLPKFKAGKEIGYTITEDAVENYTTTYDGYNVTNQYTPEQTSVTVIKVWDDADDQDGIRPKNITINLMAGGEKIDSQKIKAEDGWTHTFTGLDAYANGEKITYTITEDAVEKYDTDITGNATKGFVVTNSHTPYVVEVTGSKTWIDNNNAYETRPESITINVLADGEEVASKTVTAADGWSYKFTDLPMNKAGEEIVYTITEDTVEGYNTAISGYDVTNTLAPHETSVTVTKVWDDADNQDGKRPNGIVVNLLANGKATDESLTLSEDTWTGTFKKLDKYDAQGVLIVYTVEEEPVEGYTTKYSEDTLTITNSYTPEIVEVSGAKTWDDKDNQDGKRPESITIRLLANGEEVATATVTEEEEWSWEFTDLPKFEKGVEIVYTITEDVVEGYTPDYDDYNVTNSYTPEQTSVTVTKAWDDNDDQDGIRPEKITVNLLADGKKVDSKVIDADDKWTYTFTDLDVYAKGEKIVYTVEEKAVEGYEASITGDATKGYIITNTHVPAVVEVAGAKTWDDDNNRDGKRPESIVVNLMADGKKVAFLETSEKTGWSYKFTDLPKFNAGEEIVYTVVENAVEDYSVTYDGFNIVNSYTPSKTSITVAKRWVDGQDTDRIRPNSVTVVLYANGEEYQKIKLTEKEEWIGVFENLPVYENGALIEYTVEEIDVRGYDSAVTGNATEGFVVTNTHVVVPKTGDESNLAMYTGMLFTSMVAMAAVLFLAKPKKGKYSR